VNLGEQSVKFLCCDTNMSSGLIHIGYGVHVNDGHNQLWKSAGRYNGRSDINNSSLFEMLRCSCIMTVLHQCSLIFVHTSPLFSFPIACLSLSRGMGNPHLFINVPRSQTVLSNQPSDKVMRQPCLYPF